MLTTPEPSYTNAVILYHWRHCGHCIRMFPSWKKAVKSFPHGTEVYEIEVEDNRKVLHDMGVDLAGGVPRVVAYNREGDEFVYTGPRTPDAIAQSVSAHLITVNPRVPHPSTVLYFRHNCGYCVRFLPEYLRFAARPDSGTVLAVDTAEYPEALQGLQHPPTGVPHVVHYDVDGNETVFTGDRTVSGLKSFISSITPGREVNFEGGSLLPTGRDTRLEAALDRLQDRASVVLGPKYRRAFEPENASVCFIGSCTGDTPGTDRIYILLCAHNTPRGKPGAMACVYGSRHADMTVKIYVGKNTDTLLYNKRKSGYKPVLETNPNVQSLRTFGYCVKLS